jgi:hypothetical protein
MAVFRGELPAIAGLGKHALGDEEVEVLVDASPQNYRRAFAAPAS